MYFVSPLFFRFIGLSYKTEKSFLQILWRLGVLIAKKNEKNEKKC